MAENINDLELSERDKQLTLELETLTQLTNTINNTTDSLRHTRSQLSTFQNTVNSSDQLLEFWMKLMSQTKHVNDLMSGNVGGTQESNSNVDEKFEWSGQAELVQELNSKLKEYDDLSKKYQGLVKESEQRSR